VRNDGTGYIQDWYASTTLRAGLTAAGSLNINAIGSLTSSGITITPSSGYSVSVVTSGAGDFYVNTNQLYVDASEAGVGIGMSTPTARLHLAAGTTSAATAPLKFTNGANLTAAEAGTMEFSACHWMSDNVSSRQAIVGCGCSQYDAYDVHVVV
jgi:hypothetical protein